MNNLTMTHCVVLLLGSPN